MRRCNRRAQRPCTGFFVQIPFDYGCSRQDRSRSVSIEGAWGVKRNIPFCSPHRRQERGKLEQVERSMRIGFYLSIQGLRGRTTEEPIQPDTLQGQYRTGRRAFGFSLPRVSWRFPGMCKLFVLMGKHWERPYACKTKTSRQQSESHFSRPF